MELKLNFERRRMRFEEKRSSEGISKDGGVTQPGILRLIYLLWGLLA